MKEYIDREKLKDEFIELTPYAYSDAFNNFPVDIDSTTIFEIIDEAPTEDVEPVRHGKWNKSLCSVCNNSCLDFVTAYAEMDSKPDYCPSCGAKWIWRDKMSEWLYSDIDELIDFDYENQSLHPPKESEG